MFRFLIIFLFCSSFSYSQITEFPYGYYCLADNSECLLVIDDSDVDGTNDLNIYIGSDEKVFFYKFKSETKTYLHSKHNGYGENVKEVSLVFFSKTNVFQMNFKDLITGETKVYSYSGEKNPIKKIDNGLLDEQSFDGDQEEIESMGDYENSEENLITSNPHHLENTEFFNPKKDIKLPTEVIFYSYDSYSRLDEFFESAENMPSEIKEKVVAIVEFTNSNYVSTLCYAIFNDKENCYDCYIDKHRLTYKFKLDEEKNYLDIIDIKTKQNIGRMNHVNFSAREFTPPSTLLFGRFSIEGEPNKSIEIIDFEDGHYELILIDSEKSEKYNMVISTTNSQYLCKSLHDGSTVLTLTLDKMIGGKIWIKDLKKNTTIQADFIFN